MVKILKRKVKKYRDKLYLELDKFLYFFDKDTRNYITKFLEKYYSALSKFAHGYINACVLSMIDDAKIIEFFSLFYMMGYYFIKGLLILCLDFYDNSKLDLNFVFSYLYTIFERANCLCNKYSIDLSKYEEFMYMDVNKEFFDLQNEEANNIMKCIEILKKENNL